MVMLKRLVLIMELCELLLPAILMEQVKEIYFVILITMEQLIILIGDLYLLIQAELAEV